MSYLENHIPGSYITDEDDPEEAKPILTYDADPFESDGTAEF